MVLSPYVDLGITEDSNVYKQPTNRIDDRYIETEFGARFSSSWVTNQLPDRLVIRGNVFYADRRYDSEKKEDFNSYGDGLVVQYGEERRFRLALMQSYRKISDYDRHYSDVEFSDLAPEVVEDSNALDIRREINNLGIRGGWRVTDKLDLHLSYRFSNVNYDNENRRIDPAGGLVVPPGLDLSNHALQLEGRLGLTDKTDATLMLRQELEDQKGLDDSADSTTLRLGLRTQGAQKVIYNVSGGWERYERPSSLDADVTESISFNAEVDWFITEKLTFRCGGYNGTQWSSFYESNAIEYLSGWAGLGYRWKPSTTFSVRGVFREDDYLDPVTHQGETKDRLDRRMEGHARVDYSAPGGFLRLYLEATYDEVNSNFDFADYVDKRFILGVNLCY